MHSLDTFETTRLIARRFQPADLAELCRLHQDERVMATLGGVRSDEQTRRFLQQKIAHWDQHGFGYWIFRGKTDDHFVGRGGVQHIEVGGRMEVEIGYTVRAADWGRGFATEMARGMLALGFEQLGLPRIVCFTLTTNRASQRVMEKVGFTFEREIVHEGQLHVLYAMSRAQYNAASQLVSKKR